MPRVTIDQKPVEVPSGATLLEAGRKLGMDIPTLCHRDGYAPNTSCMVCLVKLVPSGRWMPSCATLAEEGMEVESQTPELHALRKAGLELILSDHVGDCLAPCEMACPLHVNVPQMLQQVAEGDLSGAIATLREDMPLPSVLARVCGEQCEKACRRRQVDAPAAICDVKQFVADADLASGSPHLPARGPCSGKQVAVVGSGPAGLAAAYFLLIAGHAVTVFDWRPEAGGMLRYEFTEAELPRIILDQEITLIERLGAHLRMNNPVGRELSLAQLQAEFDAVLLTEGQADLPGLTAAQEQLRGDAGTHQTAVSGVFAAGQWLRPGRQVERLAADGKAAAVYIDQYLAGGPVTGAPAPFSVHAGRLSDEELTGLLRAAGGCSSKECGQGTNLAAALDAPEGQASCPPSGLAAARQEAARCLHCECGKRDGCNLRRYAEMYGAQAGHYRGERRKLERIGRPGGVVFEPGKCILCGLCIQAAARGGEPLGLAFVGRGFDMRVAVPFGRSFDEGLTQTAQECVNVCPTGALSRSD